METARPRPVSKPLGVSSAAAAASAAATAKKMSAAAAMLLGDNVKPKSASSSARRSSAAEEAHPRRGREGPPKPIAATPAMPVSAVERPRVRKAAPPAPLGEVGVAGALIAPRALKEAAAEDAFAPRFAEAQANKLTSDIAKLSKQREELEKLLNRSEVRMAAMTAVSRDLSRASRRHRSESRSRRSKSRGGDTTDGETENEDDSEYDSEEEGDGAYDDDDSDDAYTVRTKQLEDAESVANQKLEEQRRRVREMEEAYERAKKAAEDAAAALRAERLADRARARSIGPDGKPGDGRSIVQMAQDALKPLPQGFVAFKNMSARFRSGDLPALSYHVAVVRLFTNANAAALAAAETARNDASQQAQQPPELDEEGREKPRPSPPKPLDPDELPLAVFKRFFPKLIAVLPDPKQRSVLVRLHGQWETAQQQAEQQARLREQAARALGMSMPYASALALPQIIPGSAAALGLPGAPMPVNPQSQAEFPSLAGGDQHAFIRQQMMFQLRSMPGVKKFADAAHLGQEAEVAARTAAARKPTKEELFPALNSDVFNQMRARSKSRAKRVVFRSLSMSRAAKFKPVPLHMLTSLTLGKKIKLGESTEGEEGEGEEGAEGGEKQQENEEGSAFPSLGYKPPAPSFASKPVYKNPATGAGLDQLADDAEERPAPSYNQSIAEGLTRVLDTALRTSANRGAAFLIQSGGVRAVSNAFAKVHSHGVASASSSSASLSASAGLLITSSGTSLSKWRGVFGRQKGGGNDYLEDEIKSMRVSTVQTKKGRGRDRDDGEGGGEANEYTLGINGRATIRAGGEDDDGRSLASGLTGRTGLAAGASGDGNADARSQASLFSNAFLRRRDVTAMASAGPAGSISSHSLYGGSKHHAGHHGHHDDDDNRSTASGALRPRWEKLVKMDPLAGTITHYGSNQAYVTVKKEKQKVQGRGSSKASRK